LKVWGWKDAGLFGRSPEPPPEPDEWFWLLVELWFGDPLEPDGRVDGEPPEPDDLDAGVFVFELVGFVPSLGGAVYEASAAAVTRAVAARSARNFGKRFMRGLLCLDRRRGGRPVGIGFRSSARPAVARLGGGPSCKIQGCKAHWRPAWGSP
jgi:hypothetical protein